MKNKIVIYVITILFIVLAGVIGIAQMTNVEVTSVSFAVNTEEASETIEYWENREGDLYVFLPSYTSLEQLEIQLNTTNEVFLNQQLLKDRMLCADFELNQWYELSYRSWTTKKTYRLMFVQSANVATMYVQTRSGDMSYIYRKKGNEESGNISLYTADGVLDYEGEMASLRGRGNSTWEQYEKKSFALDLEKPGDLLGMGSATDWILFANADDPSNMRNKIVYEFADKVGLKYASDLQWVDLYLNGEYTGLYLLCERIEIGENRVDVTTPSNDETGSYIVSLEMASRMQEKNDLYVTTATGQALRMNDPSKMSDEQLYAVASEWQSIENAILAEDGIDSITGKHYEELIDIDSWVRKYILEEIFVSVDACYISQYFYSDDKSVNAKVYAGPVWDFDHSMAREALIEPYAFVANRQSVNSHAYTPWFYTLYQKEEFYNRVVEIYEKEYRGAVTDLINNVIPQYKEQVSVASAMNKIRWFYHSEETIETESEVIIRFLSERIEFLDSAWIDGVDYYHVCVDTGVNDVLLFYAVLPGTSLEELPVLPEFDTMYFTGWYVKETDQPFDIAQPITGDMDIYAKWESAEG